VIRANATKGLRVLLLTGLLLAGCAAVSAAAQAATPAWAPIAASGPTNLPPTQSEVQRVAVDAEGGTYALTATTGKGSGTLNVAQGFGIYSAGATQIEVLAFSPFEVGQAISGEGIAPETEITAVETTPIEGGFEVKATLSKPTVGGAFFAIVTASSKVVTEVSTTLGSFAVGQTISGIGIPPGTTITAVGPQTLTLSAFPNEGGVQSLSATEITGPIDFDADAAELEAELNALPTLEVAVNGGPGSKNASNPYFVAFGGDLADQNVPLLSADSSGLTGGNNHLATVTTALQGGPGTTEIAIYPQNVGGAPSSGVSELNFTLPPGVTTTDTPFGFAGSFGPPWECSPVGSGQTEGTCTSTGYVAEPGVTLPPLIVPVAAGPTAADGVVHIEVSGGGALGVATYDMPLVVSGIPSPPGLQAFTAGSYDSEGAIDTRAGAHPYSASTGILVNSVRSPLGFVVPAGEFRDILVDTPPGFLGNPLATPQCPESFERDECEQASLVATAQLPLGVGQFGEFAAVTNVEAPLGYPAKFRFIVAENVIVNVVASLRSDEDYGVELGSYNTPQLKTAMGAFFTVWGTPLDAGHDSVRCRTFNLITVPQQGVDCVDASEIIAAGGQENAFLSNPVDCAEEAARQPKATVNVNLWQNPGLLFTYDTALQPVTECDKLKFAANFGFRPTETSASDSPSSFETEMTVPQGGLTDPSGRITPPIKESVIELPKGVVVNTAAADGLGACSEEQIGLKGTNFPRPNAIRFTKDPNTCPANSKIGTGEVKSDLLEDPLHGDLFLAAQEDGNPFGSLFAVYLVVEDPARGIIIKLPGEVQLDPQSGQQRIVFKDLPPFPFSRLSLKLKGGSRSPLATPTTCGKYVSTVTNTPWSAPESGPPTVSENEFAIDSGPNGQPCAATPADRPFGLDLKAGSANPTAGAFSPFSFQITRPDGAQEIDTLDVKPPPGLVASLKGIPRCSDAALAAAAAASGKDEQANSACPSGSEIGHTLVGAGSGPTPYFVPGKIYLAGPYKGAPLSLAAITPAVAGPFDLGTVVIRSAVYIDPVTSQITAKTDPLPQMLKGVPVRARDLRVILDRPGFSLNPTNCEPSQIQATVTGNSGAVANLSQGFQVGGCDKLGFKPQIKLTLAGGTKRADNPQLTAVVTPRPGDANIASASVKFPHSAFLDQSHIRTVCTRVQFAADACPKAAIYGQAEAVTPILDEPVKGPVYLRSSNNPLPDLVADLRGPADLPIKVEASFRTDSVKAALRSTLDFAPDVPVTRFTLKMQGGKKSLLVNSQNLCAHANRATARFKGQNGRTFEARPKVVALKCKKHGRHKRHRR